MFSSLIGLFQQDIKKVIAYSTMSQLAREYTSHSSIFRHQTVCEHIVFTIKILIYFSIFFWNISFRHFLRKESTINKFGRASNFFLLLFIIIKKNNPKVKIVPSLPQFRCFSTISKELDYSKLNPYYVTGFTDAEGCFLINIVRRSDLKLGYNVNLGAPPSFKIKLHLKDKLRGHKKIKDFLRPCFSTVRCGSKLLEKIRNFFDKIALAATYGCSAASRSRLGNPAGRVGNITVRKNGSVEYVVSSIKDLEIVINHFDNYPLITHKWSDFQLFKWTFELIKQKQHLVKEGLYKILSLKASLNKGLSDELNTAFPDIVPFARPKVITPKLKDKNPHWISGFVDGDGCFYISLTNNLTSIGLIFKVTQHTRDADLLKEFIDYFNCGRYSICSKEAGDFIVTKFSDINTKIIPFFNKYPLQGTKLFDFLDFNKVAKLVENKTHLTSEGALRLSLIPEGDKGLEIIKQIKMGTNRGRLTSPKITYTQKRTYITIRSHSNKSEDFSQISFNEWLAGLIDGKGQFFVSKKGYANFKIVMKEEDKLALYNLKHKFGGSIKNISSETKLKYKLDHRKGLIQLINSVNGLIRNPARMLELNKVCLLYNIEFKMAKPLTYLNGWFSGFLDSDGSIYFNEKSNQLILSVTQKNKYLLDPIRDLYSGRILLLKSKEAFEYSIYRKQEILNLIDNYLINYPLKSSKRHKIDLIKQLFSLDVKTVYPSLNGQILGDIVNLKKKQLLIEKINYK